MTKQNVMKLTSENVTAIFLDSLFREEEVADKGPMLEEGTYLLGSGVVTKVGFHPERCRGHKESVVDMLNQLDDSFKRTEGETFLNMCADKSGALWTGQQRIVDQLVCLGVALELLTLTPRERNSSLPGGVPFVMVKLSSQTE